MCIFDKKVFSCFLLFLFFSLPQLGIQAGETKTKREIIYGRVLSIEDNGSRVRINRGKGDNIISGAKCVIRPNRGETLAEIEWDLYFAKGEVEKLDETEAVIKLTEIQRPVKNGDLCEMEAIVPEFLLNSDIGRIAIFDIQLLDYQNNEPLFQLRDLIKDPNQRMMDLIIQKLIQEININADVAKEQFIKEKINGGIFDGMSLDDAFRKTKREHIEKYLEYLSWNPGNSINFSLVFIETYASWVNSRMTSGEPSRLEAAASPYESKGDNLVIEGKYQEAIDTYKKALEIYPNSKFAKTKLDLVLGMLAEIKKIEQDPNDAKARFDLGLKYYNLKRYKDALQQFLEARKLGYDPEKIEVWTGAAYGCLEQYEKARKIFENLIKKSPKDENLKFWLAYVSVQGGQDKKSTSAESHIKLGNFRYQNKEYNDAISEYNKALDLEHKSSRIWELIFKTVKRRNANKYQVWAKYWWANGQFESSKTYWEKAISLCEEIKDVKSVIDIIDEMADAMYGSDFIDDAINARLRILKLDKNNYKSYNEIINCYGAKKDYKTAIQWAEKGIKINQKNAWGYNLLGYYLLQIGDLDKVIVNLKKAVKIDPNYKDALLNLGKAYVLKGNVGDAQRLFRRILEIDKDASSARSYLVAIEVILETKELLKENPNNSNAQLRMGMALYELGDYKRAITELEKIIKTVQDPSAYAYLGYSYTQLQQFDKGRTSLKKAYELQPKSDLESWLLYLDAQASLAKNQKDPDAFLKLGDDSLYWEKYDQALALFQKALNHGANPGIVSKKMETARKGKDARFLYDTSVDCYNRSEFQKSLEKAELSLKLYQEIGARRGEQHTLIIAGWSHAGLFEHKKALEKFGETGGKVKLLGNDIMKAYYLSGLCYYYNNIGDYSNAVKYSEQARVLFYNNNQLIQAAEQLVNMGWAKGQMGEFNAMITNYQQALIIQRNVMNYTGEANVLNSIGSAYKGNGDYSQALEYVKNALHTSQRYKFRSAELDSYRNIGNIYYELGDAENGLKYCTSYLEYSTALGYKSERANALNQIGIIYLELKKDYEKAWSLFQESLNLSRIIGYRILEGVAVGNLGVVLLRQEKYEEALRYQKDSLKICREQNDAYIEMQVLNETGETYQKMKQWDMALEVHIKAIDIATAISVPTERWQFELNAAKAYEGKGDFKKAIEHYKQAAGIVAAIKNKIKSDALKKGFSDQEKQMEVYKSLIDLLVKAGRTTEALQYIEESKSKIIRDAFSGIKPVTADSKLNETLKQIDKMEKKKDAIEKQIKQEKQKPADGRNQTKLTILTKTLANTEGEFNQCMLELKFQNRKMYDALSIKPTTLGAIQNEIPQNTLLLEYFVSSDKLYIFCIGNRYFFAKSIDIPEKDIVKLVYEYSRSVQKEPGPSSKSKQSLKKKAARLYDILIRQVEKEIEPFDNIVIVPFGVLFYLPFHALIREENGKQEYFIEKKRISYATSATFTDILKNKKKNLDKIIAFGNPDGTLGGASEEVKKIKNDVFKMNAMIFTLRDATKKNFFMFAKDHDIVHIATHGIVSKNPLKSYLLFAGQSTADQQLTLREIAGYTALREKTNLIFLSACETAVEDNADSGSELISLGEAFAMAGSSSLIATLWEVADISTSMLVSHFYNELKKGDKDILDSLRAAQLSLLQNKDYSDPYFWAPFIMFGSWK